MNTRRINEYLANIAAHNNRDWFQKNKKEFDIVRADFEEGVGQAIAAIAKFDSSVSHLSAKDCCFRFYRDVRFSPDKSPYKRHFGAYISAKGRKSLHAGYYLQLMPGRTVVSAGPYWLPTNILTSMRNEIMGNIEEWRRCVENGKFVSLFGYANAGYWDKETMSAKGFGMSRLKTVPKGFPRDYEFVDYLKMKDYVTWHVVEDGFFEGDAWKKPMSDMLRAAKPLIDFTNNVIDDYI